MENRLWEMETMNKDRLQQHDGSMAESPEGCGGVVMESARSLTGIEKMTRMMRAGGSCRTDVSGSDCRRGETRGAWHVLCFTLLALQCLFFAIPTSVYAAEAVTNGILNGSTNWVLGTDATYDAGTTRTADGSGSTNVNSLGRNNLATGSLTQTLATQIPSGSTIDAVAIYAMTTGSGTYSSSSVTIDLQYSDLTTLNVFSGTMQTPPYTWWNLSPNLATVPVTTSATLAVTAVIVSYEIKNGNDAAANYNLNVDDISIAYTAPAANNNPDAPTNPAQYQNDGSTSIAVGGYALSTTVVFEGDLSDPDADTVKLQIDYTGDNASDCESALVASGSTNIQASCPGLTDGNSYDWQYRAVDSNSAVSAWTAFNIASPDFNIDATVPSVSSTFPLTDATGVTLDGLVNITWDENIDCTTVNTTNITSDSPGWSLASCGGAVASFNTSGQANGTLYNVDVTTAVKDLAGNPMSAAYPFSYTTTGGDVTPPTVSTTFPLNGATGVTLDGLVNITWDENIDCTTVNTTNIISDSPGWSLASCAGAVASFNTIGQANGTVYNVNVTTAVKDLAGNLMSAAYPFSFTTVAAGNVAPTDITLSPNKVTDGTDTTAGYDMTLGAVDVDGGETFTFTKTGLGADQTKFSISGNTLTLTDGLISYATPGDVNADRVYEVEVQVEDVASNTFLKTVLVIIIPAYNPLIHSSLSTNSTKHGGDWGTATGKYGEFTCSTCHQRGSTNIKRVRSTITAPFGSFPGSTVAFTDTRDGSSDFGDDGRLDKTQSTNICEVCHTYDAAQLVGVNVHAYVMPGDSGHDNKNDCVTCHLHQNGFDASCAACHGNPPVTDDASSTGLVFKPGTTDATNPISAGAHELHAVTVSMTCTTCHKGNTMPAVSNTIQMGFEVSSANWSGFGDTVTTGTLDAPDEGAGQMSASFSFISSSAGTVINTVANNNLTCAVYCHGDWIGNGGQTATSWVGGSTMADDCNDCHGGSATTPPTAGSHTTHAGSGGLNLACSKCHPSYSDTGHLDGDVAWSLDIADSKFSATAAYSGSDSASTGSKAPSISYGQCSGIYCHSSGQSTDGASTTPYAQSSPTWGGAAACGTCHHVTTGAGLVSGSHSKHLALATVGCDACHTGAANDASSYVSASHVDGTIDAANSYNSPGVPGDGYGECTNASCHDNGTGTTVNSPTWGAAGTCASCHASDMTSGSHTIHRTQTIMSALDCGNCHDGAVKDTSAPSQHLDGDIDVFDVNPNDLGYPINVAKGGAPYSSCTVTYCHGDAMPNGDNTGSDTSPLWGASLTSCGLCHGFPPTPAGTHNGITLETQCGNCHDQTMTGGSAGIADTSLHINGTIDVNVSCTGCHTGSGSGHQAVGADSPHSTNTIAGSPSCESCHFADHGSRTTGTFGIGWDARTMGADYTADGKIYIVGSGSEAESCWACHESQTPDVSEWDGSNAVYDYGSVTPNDLNWFTTSWSSANFNYKSGVLASAMGSSASTHGTNGGATGVDVAGEVSCTSCHDVHGINNSGVSTTSAPYLRGSWKASAYNEDGAPGEYNNSGGGSGTSTYLEGATYGIVPRSSALTTNGMGGYWIDQNSGSPDNGTYATHAGLCTLCHGDGDAVPAEAADVTAIETAWAGHENSVAGGTHNGTNNIFSNTTRIGNGVWNGLNEGPYMGNQGIVTFRGSNYGGTIRNDDYGDGVVPIISGKSRPFLTFQWAGLSVDDNTVNKTFHNFSCSKCHNPHASRLPKLMITNCLDTGQNTWDDDFKGDTNWGGNNFSSMTYGTNELAKSSSAQNCHRYVSGQETSGWNTVTPW
jgi:predicted CxxxxCH...CXXCH cytochrome family protein